MGWLALAGGAGERLFGGAVGFMLTCSGRRDADLRELSCRWQAVTPAILSYDQHHALADPDRCGPGALIGGYDGESNIGLRVACLAGLSAVVLTILRGAARW